MRISRIIPAAALAATLVPALAGAQWKITTFGGYYAPTTHLAKETASFQGTSATATLKQKPGFMLGVNANKWLNDRAGFELSGGYSWTDQELSANVGTTGGSLSSSSYVGILNAKVLVRLLPQTSTSELYAGVGPAVIFGKDNTWSDLGTRFERGTDVGGVVSLGYRYSLTSGIALKLGAEAYGYSAKVKMVDTADPTSMYTSGTHFQTDFVFSTGLSFTLPGMTK